MNRRELLKRLAGGFAVAGIAPMDVQTHEAPCEPSRALVVLKPNGPLSIEQQGRIRACWARAVADSPWQEARVIVLDHDMTLHVEEYADDLGSRSCRVHGWHLFGPRCSEGF
jgi:hypothetical protein